MKAIYYGDTNIGSIRSKNEDAFLLKDVWGGSHLLAICVDGVMGYIGVQEKVGVNIPCKYDMMGHFNEKGYTAASQYGNWGVIDVHDNIVEPFIYERAYNPGYKDTIALELNDKCNFI